MRVARATGLGLFAIASILAAQPPRYSGLPADALVLEEQPLPSSAHEHRALILWVWPSKQFPLKWVKPPSWSLGSQAEDNDVYTCPEQATGHTHYYHTRTRVSLADTASGQIINTLPVTYDVGADPEAFDIPFQLRAGLFYKVPGTLRKRCGQTADTRFEGLQRRWQAA
jgi:hypothetical protein